jgi:hypothetical protein
MFSFGGVAYFFTASKGVVRTQQTARRYRLNRIGLIAEG